MSQEHIPQGGVSRPPCAQAQAQTWVCGSHVLDLTTPKIMGILNATPDSFSDGGSFSTPTQAIAHGLDLVEQGADIVDVGGESTRPGSIAPSAQEECERIILVIEALAAQGVLVSVDTYKPEVAAAALEAGAAIINDISGFRDPRMIEVALAPSRPGLVLMHMQGTPQTMQAAPHYDDVVTEVAGYLRNQALDLERRGVDTRRIALDPGFGFGKTSAHNLEILRRTETFADLGYPLVVAVSRKKTIGEISGEKIPRDRVIGSVVAAVYAVERGARIVRVHDVKETKQALTLLNTLSFETH